MTETDWRIIAISALARRIADLEAKVRDLQHDCDRLNKEHGYTIDYAHEADAQVVELTRKVETLETALRAGHTDLTVVDVGGGQ